MRVIRAGISEIAHLQAVSLGGLTLSGIRTLTAGETVDVQVGDASFSVEVVWAHGMTCGARFLPNTDPADVLRLRALSQPRKSSEKPAPGS